MSILYQKKLEPRVKYFFRFIQVLGDTYEILKNRGFEFEERGYVYVKGKGKLLTYVLVTQQSYDYTRPQRPMKNDKKVT